MKDVEIFLGRFQPIHLGHKKIIDSMQNPIVIIVKGEKSSNDKKRNPLDADYQKKLLQLACPNVEVTISPNAFLPGIINYLRKQHKNVTTIYAGADRIDGYKKMIEQNNARAPSPEYHYDIKFKETDRFTSATTVRNAIRNNDYDTFKKLVPKAIWNEWLTLKQLLSNISEDIFIEDEDMTSTNNISNYPSLLFKKTKQKFLSFDEFKKENNE